jgi:hypothetical protein
MARNRKRKPKVPDPVMYWLNVIDWHSSYSATRDGPELPDFFREEDGAPWEHLAVDLDVELREPVKGVTKGKANKGARHRFAYFLHQQSAAGPWRARLPASLCELRRTSACPGVGLDPVLPLVGMPGFALRATP